MITPQHVVDLRSDTVTQPCDAMREAIANAVVGDDVFQDDPTVIQLQNKMAELSGKERALFVPSGTMGNLISVLAHCWQRGSEVLLGDTSHIHIYEQGGVSQLGGVHARSLINREDGTFSLEELQNKIRADDPHLPVTRLVAIENSHNKCGGRALPLHWVEKLSVVCRSHGIPLHCDAARIFNSCVSQGVDLKTSLQHIDSASICFSKGLGCPVGSVIVGGTTFIERAIRLRKVLGGGMRQAGILAAACLYAIENNIDKLEKDHKYALQLAQTINQAGKDRFTVNMACVETNLVLMQIDKNIASPKQILKELDMGLIRVRAAQFSHNQVRFAFHLMIEDKDYQLAAEKIIQTINKFLS